MIFSVETDDIEQKKSKQMSTSVSENTEADIDICNVPKLKK